MQINENRDHRIKFIQGMLPTIIVKEFRDIKLLKAMDNETYYYISDINCAYSHRWNWTYIEANSEYENRIIKRINITQEYIKQIKDMKLVTSKGEIIIPYVNDLIDIVIPSLDVVISNIDKYTCRVEYAGSAQPFENKEIHKTELKDIFEYLANK